MSAAMLLPSSKHPITPGTARVMDGRIYSRHSMDSKRLSKHHNCRTAEYCKEERQPMDDQMAIPPPGESEELYDIDPMLMGKDIFPMDMSQATSLVAHRPSISLPLHFRGKQII
jgi:hypothetical protein